jgi:ABC-type dipeptide/oligopeptide/nickel transport system ATPase subunit
MQIYNISNVFNESEIPILIFVEPREFSDIVGSILTTGKHITLSGPSGCGKTTLARKALDESGRGPGDIHWISGRDYSGFSTLKSIFAKEFSCTESTDEITEYLGAAGIVIPKNKGQTTFYYL